MESTRGLKCSKLSGSKAAVAIGLIGCASWLVGCDKKESEQPRPADARGEAPSATPPVAPELEEAMKEVARAAAPQAQGGKAPPPNGIFAPGGADAEIRALAPPIFTLGARGGEPKVLLAAQPSPGLKRQGRLEISLDVDAGSPAVPVALELRFETRALPGSEGKVRVVVVVERSEVLASAAGVLPPDVEADLKALRGSELSYELGAAGSATRYAHKLGAKQAEGFAQVLMTALDIVSTLTAPLPAEPVGPGAFWLVTAREGVWGLDLVSYKILRVVSVEGDRATLKLETRRYAAKPQFDSPFVGSDAPLTMVKFDAPAEAQLVVRKGEPFPESAELRMKLQAAVMAQPADGSQPETPAQLIEAETGARLTLKKD